MKTVSVLIAFSLIVSAFSVYAVPPRIGAVFSPTRSFSLNGRWFSVGKPSRIDTVLQDELTKRGLDISRIRQEPEYPNDTIIDTLSELPSNNIQSRFSSVPVLFSEKNTLRAVSDAGIVNITIGNVSTGGNLTRKKLLAKGWKIVETGKASAPGFMATTRSGRETSVVFLEEKTGDCLYIRRLEK